MDLLKIDLDLTNLFKETIEWNRVANNGYFEFTDAKRNLQHKCLEEELNELETAIRVRDPVEVIDAICDILFVGVYAWHMRVSSSTNLSCVSNNPGQVSANLTLEDLHKQLKTAFEEYEYFSLCQLVLSACLAFDFNLKDAYQEVVNSNFSKFPLADDIDIEEELVWFKNCSKYEDVICTRVEGGRCVFRAHYGCGKVVKPQCFREPELTQFIRGKALLLITERLNP